MFHRMMNYGELEARPTAVLTIDLIKKISPKFKRHDDLIIVQEQAWEEFKKALTLPVSRDENSPFSIDEDELASLVCQTVQKPICRRLAIERRVKNDGYRRPTVELLLGPDGIVRHKDNHILYQFDVTKCMFSFGNVREKMRMAALDCSEEIVVDLFAGIGYFTLPLLVHSKAKHLYACEWNPDAIEALRKNLILNKIKSDRYTVIEGDNRSNRPTNVAQRVLLGILPSCMDFMKTALDCVDKQTGAILHCHDLVETIEVEKINDKYQKNSLSNATTPLSVATATTTTTTTTNSNHFVLEQSLNSTSTISSHSTVEKLSVPLVEDMRLQSSESNNEISHSESVANNSVETTNNTSNAHNNNKFDGINHCNHSQISATTFNNHGDDRSEQQQQRLEDDRDHNCDDDTCSPTLHMAGDDEIKNAFQLRAKMLIERIEDDLEKYKLTSKLLGIQTVKSYAPHVYHVVFDIKLEPAAHKL